MATFSPLLDVTSHWRDFPAPWFVAGGWAIDLFLGRVTRSHHDVELAIFREDQARLPSHFSAWAWHACTTPGEFQPWNGEPLVLPYHQLQAEGTPLFDVLLNERDGDLWRFRRDPAIARPLADTIAHTPDGLPYLRPEITLLYKAKYQRPQDEADMALVLPHLAAADRAWLGAAIQLVHPGHPWQMA